MLRKQYQQRNGLLQTIYKKIPNKHTIDAGVFGQMVGCASANPLLVAGTAGLFSAGVVTKAGENL